MLGIEAKAARTLWTALVFGAGLALVWLLRDLWFLLTVALLFSYLLWPVISLVERTIPKRWAHISQAKELPLLVVYLLLLGALITVAGWIGSQVVAQATGLAEKLPELVRRREVILAWPLPVWLEPLRASLLEWAQGFLEGGFKELLPVFRDLSGRLLSGLGSLTLFLLVPVFSFYFLKDGQSLAQTVINRFPYDARRTVGEIFGDLHRLLSQYMRALVLLSLAALVSYEVFFWATGMPYSTLLAVLAAVLEFIPVAGPVTAGGVAVLVAAFSGYPHILWLVIFLLAYRVFQDYVLQPYLMSQGIELHPLLVLAGILAGEQLAGVAGVFLAIPAVAAFRIVYLKLEKPSVRN